MWTHLYWLGVTGTSGKSPAKEFFFDITRIRSKSPTLKPLSREHKISFT